jgi:hypothetical protein
MNGIIPSRNPFAGDWRVLRIDGHPPAHISELPTFLWFYSQSLLCRMSALATKVLNKMTGREFVPG